MPQEKVLLVDDEPEFVSALAERMSHRGFKVDSASTGPEALHRTAGGDYDAIVLDLAMPGMDGIETLKKLLAGNPGLQVILLTGHASLQQGVEAMKIGAVDFLEKPADIETLARMIREAKANKMLLVEKQIEDKMKDILGNKAW